MVIGLVSIKGGSGKSTIAVNFACWLSKEKNKDVLLIDADPQASAALFSNIQSQITGEDESLPFTTISKNGVALKNVIDSFRNKYDYIIVDTPGKNTVEAKATLIKADMVLIPIIPSQFDTGVFEESTLVSFDDAKAFNENLLGLMIPYRTSTHPKDKDVDSLREIIAQAENEHDGLGAYKDKICTRTAFSKSISEGKSVFFAANKDKKAIDEMNRLFSEVINIENKYIGGE